MHALSRAPAGRLIVVGLLAAGWLVGLVAQREVALETGYLDVSPQLLVLGMVLATLAGAAGRLFRPADHRIRVGALAGMGLLVTIVAGYMALVVLYIDEPFSEEGGETWFTFLLESWFWVGVPLLVSAALGALGWAIADWLGRRSS